MSFQTLNANLVDLVTAITTISEVSASPKMQFDSYPAAFIAESGNESEFQSSQDHVRIYAFNVWLFQEFDVTSVPDAYSILRGLVDTLIDKMDGQESPEGVNNMATGLAAGKTLVSVLATPAQFVYDETAKMLAARVSVRCKVLVDLTSID